MFDRAEYNRKYQQEHKEKLNEKSRKWRAANPEKVREANHKQYLKRKAKKEAARNGSD